LHAVALRQGQHHLGFEAALDVYVEFGLGQPRGPVFARLRHFDSMIYDWKLGVSVIKNCTRHFPKGSDMTKRTTYRVILAIIAVYVFFRYFAP
jgi:hypothetical protein